MIATTKTARSDEPTSTWQVAFIAILPMIRRYARVAFRSLPPQTRDDAVSEVVADCCVAFCRLAERGRLHVAHPSVLARYAVFHFCGGRMVGGRLNVRDVLSTYAQRQKQIRVDRLDRFDPCEGEWREIVVEDRRAGPAETAATRIDFAAWLTSLPDRKRCIAELLATGESTGAAAQQSGVTAGRVSQLRRELKDSWELFVSS